MMKYSPSNTATVPQADFAMGPVTGVVFVGADTITALLETGLMASGKPLLLVHPLYAGAPPAAGNQKIPA
ncbi:MAG TPA: hypothetical protein VK717_05745 [Opitutaceae bacterium]|nr:hypothetical protein [Opitutaceae bacterium]